MNRLPPIIRSRAAAGRLPLLLAAGLLGACGTPDAVARGPQAPVDYVARPLLSSDSSAELSGFGAVTVDSRGSVYVADMGSVLVFGPDGRVQRRIGREGDGPGEFRSFGTIEILPGDSLYVFDTNSQRATVFRPYSTEVAYTLRLGREDYSFASQVLPVGGTHTLVGLYRTAVGSDVRGAETERRDVLRVFNPDGSLRRDSVLTLREPERLELSAGRTQGFFWPPFARKGIVRFGQDGRIYSAWTDTPRVSVHDLDGRARGTFTAQVQMQPLPLTEQDIDSAASLIARPPFTRAPTVQALRERWTTWPVLEDLLVDDVDRVWLKLRTGAAASTWMAFRQTGERVGSMTLPPNVHPMLIRGDRLYAAALDEVDVPTLMVYELVPSPADGEAL